MDEPNLEPDYSHPIFTSAEQVAKFLWDRLENDNGAMTSSELAAAVYHLATNLDFYMKQCTMLRMQLDSVILGGDEAQRMMDNVEKHRDQYRIRQENKKRQPL